MGEKQRHGLEPTYVARPTHLKASQRLFLCNCSTESVRELRAKMGGVEVAYEPVVGSGAFTEIHWTRDSAIRERLLQASEHEILTVPLEVEFAIADGMKRAILKGSFSLDASDGWIAFRSSDQSEKEIE